MFISFAVGLMIIFRARSPSSAQPRVSYPPSPGVENPSNRDARRAERIPHSYPNRSLRGIRLHHRLHPRQRTRSTRPPRLSDQDRRARAARSRDIFLSKRETNERKTNERRWFTRNDDDGTTTTTTTTNIYNGYVIARTRRRRRPSRRKNRFVINQTNPDGSLHPFLPFVSFRRGGFAASLAVDRNRRGDDVPLRRVSAPLLSPARLRSLASRSTVTLDRH